MLSFSGFAASCNLEVIVTWPSSYVSSNILGGCSKQPIRTLMRADRRIRSIALSQLHGIPEQCVDDLEASMRDDRMPKRIEMQVETTSYLSKHVARFSKFVERCGNGATDLRLSFTRNERTSNKTIGTELARSIHTILRGMPQLRDLRLRFSKCGFSSEASSVIAGALYVSRGLQEFELAGMVDATDATERLVSGLTGLPSLRRATVYQPYSPHTGAAGALSGLVRSSPSLCRLKISMPTKAESDNYRDFFDAIGKSTTLTELSLGAMLESETCAGLGAALAASGSLKKVTLDMGLYGVDDGGVTAADFADHLASGIAGSSGLETLWLTTPLGGTGESFERVLAEHAGLKHVAIRPYGDKEDKVISRMLRGLAENPHAYLRSLVLRECMPQTAESSEQIEASSLRGILSQQSRLERLRVIETWFKRPGHSQGMVRSIETGLAQSASLRCLTLSCCPIGATDSTLILRTCLSHAKIEFLAMAFTDMTPECASPLCELIAESTSLHYLDVSNNQLDLGRSLGVALASPNAALETLILTKAGMTAAGTAGIAEALLVNDTLTELDISDNELNAKGGMDAIGKALEVNCSLQILRAVPPSDEPPLSSACIRSISRSRSLCRLQTCADTGSEAVSSLVGSCRTLQELFMVHHRILPAPTPAEFESFDTLAELIAGEAPGLRSLRLRPERVRVIDEALSLNRAPVAMGWMREPTAFYTDPRGASTAACILRMLPVLHDCGMPVSASSQFAEAMLGSRLEAGDAGGCVVVLQALLEGEQAVKTVPAIHVHGYPPPKSHWAEESRWASDAHRKPQYPAGGVYHWMGVHDLARKLARDKRGRDGWRGAVLRCDALVELEAKRRRGRMAVWRRAMEAKRDAGKVFQAARDGRPLELGKRLRLGVLAGGLDAKGYVDDGAGGTRLVSPLEAARLGGHEECVKLLTEHPG